jgi:uncharacterized integral membrane protein
VTRLAVLAFCACVAVGPLLAVVVATGRWVDRRRRLRRFHHAIQTHLREHTTYGRRG